nr:hypothetical protein [Oscillospiraceae bacterium]
MDDLERYGDYNETDDLPPSRNTLSLVLKILTTVIILAVVGVVGVRVFIFNYYPKEMRTLHFTDALTQYYNDQDGDIGALTQSLRAPYDDPDEGNFFCDHLIVVPEIGQLQVCLRYNVSLADSLSLNYGLSDFDTENTEQFSFRLWRNGDESSKEGYEVGRLVYSEWDSFAMYRYCKLVFEDVSLLEDTDWIRLEVFIDGVDKETPFMIAVYENNEDYSEFKEYKPGRGELPE